MYIIHLIEKTLKINNSVYHEPIFYTITMKKSLDVPFNTIGKNSNTKKAISFV